MLLAIDVGNTTTVIGGYEGETLACHWRVQTEQGITEDEFYLLLKNLFSAQKRDLKRVTATIISCVVPPMVNSLNRFCEKYVRHAPIWVDATTVKQMPVAYDSPKEVGADRLVNAIAAFRKYAGSVVVVDFGTATTFDCISESGVYLGGAISPGILIASEALFQKASKLPRVEIFGQPGSVIAKDTVSSMRAGIIYGYAGLVDGIVERIKREMSSPPKVVATGGLADLMMQVAETIEVVEPHLTLEGLRILYGELG
jgi:type III pantothenate kinase